MLVACTCRATGRGGANGSLRFELGARPNTNQNIIDAAGLCDRWRTMINNALAADPKVREKGDVKRGSSCSAAALAHQVGCHLHTWQPQTHQRSRHALFQSQMWS